MKVLISIGLWGRSYAELFVNYALASQLSDGNIPRLAKEHDVTYHIVTTRADGKWLRDQPAVRELARHASVDWDFVERHGFDPILLPTGPEGTKYTFLSLIQNIAIEKSLSFDALIFNYADFIWSDGSLPNTIEQLDEGVDSVLSFCLPVDRDEALVRLDAIRDSHTETGAALNLAPREGAAIAIDCLHREARLRYWDDPPFTITPTYLLWRVENEGLIIRAYHQTILAMRVRPDDDDYRNGISYGSLDGHYTTLLAARNQSRHAVESDDVFVFSLYDTPVDSSIGGPSRHNWAGFDRDASLRECLRNVISPDQRRFATLPIYVRRTEPETDAWNRIESESGTLIEHFDETSPFDQKEYDELHKTDTSLEEHAKDWRRTATHTYARVHLFLRQRLIHRPRNAAYAFLLRVFGGRLGQGLKKILGADRARAIRLGFERLIYLTSQRTGSAEELPDLSKLTMLPTADQGRMFIEAGHAKPLAETVGRFMGPIEAVPNYELSVWAQACLHSGLYTEHVLNDISDLDQMRRLLEGAEWLLHEASAHAPHWPEAHRAWARNLWFQGRFDEAIVRFQEGENQLSALAGQAEWPPGAFVALPRNCAHVIGLMGHLDAFVKMKKLTGDPREYFLIAPENEIVNPVFLDYWRGLITVIEPGERPVVVEREPAYSVNWNWVLPGGEGKLVHVHRGMARIQRRWAEERGGDSLLHLSEEHRNLLETRKAAWGMAADSEYVCIHVRSAGFYEDKDGTAQHFRNTPIADYYPMIRAVVDAGYWVVRMGDAATPPLDLAEIGGNTDRIIDYAHSDNRSPELDVALCAECRLFVSSPSGLHTVAHAFGRPACYVNFPIYAGFPWHPDEILCPQRYYSHEHGRVLSIGEILSSDLVHADHQFLLDMRKVELLRNSPEDIRETVLEALDPEHYSTNTDADGAAVRAEFDRLNEEHKVDISGRLGLYFASAYADELCPERDGA